VVVVDRRLADVWDDMGAAGDAIAQSWLVGEGGYFWRGRGGQWPGGVQDSEEQRRQQRRQQQHWMVVNERWVGNNATADGLYRQTDRQTGRG